MRIRQRVLGALDEAIEIRRELHINPEISLEEYKTQQYVYSYLERLEPDELTKIANTGVKAVFYADNAKRTTAFRADMDALPLTEKTGLPFASRNEGVMHACGHDAHMAIMLVSARLVSENRDKLNENVVFLFQPAEEGCFGAERMIECGAMENPRIDRIFGFHVLPGVPTGKMRIKEGVFTAHTFGFDIIVHGLKAHGALPNHGNDAIVAAAHLVTMLQTIVARNVSPDESAVLTIGAINGGQQRNIICDEVKLECTLRTFSDEVHELIVKRIKELLAGIENGFGVKTEMNVIIDNPCVINDEELARECFALIDDAAEKSPRLTIGEDFAMYQQITAGMFVGLGVGNHTALHTATFDIDEDSMVYAIEMNMRLLGI